MRRRADFTDTIAQQVTEYLPLFKARVGVDMDAVFRREQEDLRRAGLPAGIAAVGDRMPQAVLTRPAGVSVRVSELLRGAAAVVVFHRGLWCPFCNIALKTYQQELRPVVEALGTRLIAVSPEAPELAAASARAAGLKLEMYSDEGNALARSLGIVTTPTSESTGALASIGIDVAGFSMDGTPTIPFPTVVVTDATGTIRFIDVHMDYTTRTETCDIVDALIAL